MLNLIKMLDELKKPKSKGFQQVEPRRERREQARAATATKTKKLIVKTENFVA